MKRQLKGRQGMSPRLSLFLVPLVLLVGAIRADAQAPMPAGDVEAGKRAWAPALRCGNCHGPQGECGYGPDLAGRGISAEAFRMSVRRPWGVMPAYTETQLSVQTWPIYVCVPEWLAPSGEPRGKVDVRGHRDGDNPRRAEIHD